MKKSKVYLKCKIEAVKSKGFIDSYSGYEGLILYNYTEKIRCFIYKDKKNIEFRKYFDFNDKSICAIYKCDYKFCNLPDHIFLDCLSRSFNKSIENLKLNRISES